MSICWDTGWQQTLAKMVKLWWEAQQKECLGLEEGRKWEQSLSCKSCTQILIGVSAE